MVGARYSGMKLLSDAELPITNRDDDIVQKNRMEQRVKNIVVGSLLGDGWLNALSPQTGTATFYLKYNDKSLDYLLWIRNELSELSPSPLKVIPKYSQHYFYTQARTDLGDLRKIFYPNEGKKRVPINIDELLTDPLILAIWYQDDGTLDRRSKYHWNARIATYCFSYDDCMRLKNAMLKNFNVEVSVCRNQMRGKVYYELYILSKSMHRFIDIVKPHINHNYAYKILANNC